MAYPKCAAMLLLTLTLAIPVSAQQPLVGVDQECLQNPQTIVQMNQCVSKIADLVDRIALLETTIIQRTVRLGELEAVRGSQEARLNALEGRLRQAESGMSDRLIHLVYHDQPYSVGGNAYEAFLFDCPAGMIALSAGYDLNASSVVALRGEASNSQGQSGGPLRELTSWRLYARNFSNAREEGTAHVTLFCVPRAAFAL